jgi:hypothetical protein
MLDRQKVMSDAFQRDPEGVRNTMRHGVFISHSSLIVMCFLGLTFLSALSRANVRLVGNYGRVQDYFDSLGEDGAAQALGLAPKGDKNPNKPNLSNLSK